MRGLSMNFVFAKRKIDFLWKDVELEEEWMEEGN